MRYDLQSERFPQQEGFDELIIVRSETQRVEDEPFRREGGGARHSGAGDRSDRKRAHLLRDDDRSLISPDGHATMIPISLAEPGEDHIEEVLEVVEHFDDQAGFDVAITGEFISTETSERCRRAICRTASCVSASPLR